MLKRITIPGVELPDLFVARTSDDVKVAMDAGLPFIKWASDEKTLLKVLIVPNLMRRFPGILWDKVLPADLIAKAFKTKVVVCDTPDHRIEDVKPDSSIANIEEETSSEMACVTDDYRIFSVDGKKTASPTMCLSVEDYVGDVASSVDLGFLQELALLPMFLDDIVDCIRTNLSNQMRWTEGYNKKLGVPIGRFRSLDELPNLIILDVSGSIPRGISSTMLSLVDTMRSQIHADLIITGSISKFFPFGSDLPTPTALRKEIGYENEASMFYEILIDHVFQRRWGHVISFGDNDAPSYFDRDDDHFTSKDLHRASKNLTIEHVHHYHTRKMLGTGYALWCAQYSSNTPEESYDTSWCKIITD